jgi:hypothetical protein
MVNSSAAQNQCPTESRARTEITQTKEGHPDLVTTVKEKNEQQVQDAKQFLHRTLNGLQLQIIKVTALTPSFNYLEHKVQILAH